MKTGDIFSRMSSEQRLRQIAVRRYHFQEVYQTPDELIADLLLLLVTLDVANTARDKMAADVRRMLNAKDEILTGISDAFKRFDHNFNASRKESPL